MTSFADALHALCIAEIQRAYGRPDASGQLVADLTSATASAIALLMAHNALGTQQLAHQTADSLPVMVAQKAAHARSGLRELGALVWPADAEVPPAPARGPLNAADASALGTSLDAGTLVILARDRTSRPSAATWATGVGASVMAEHEAGQLWSAFVAVSRKLAEPSA